MENSGFGNIETHLRNIEHGGVTSAKGFAAAGVHAGFRNDPERLDLAIVAAREPCPAAGVFTQNVFCAAPVQFSKSQFEKSSGNPGYGTARAVIINSGNANAATGAQGIEAAQAESQLVADALSCASDEVLVASTGVIGVQLPLDPFRNAVPHAAESLSSESGADAARAIMTTDTVPKECAVSFDGSLVDMPGTTFTVGGMAKGSGMIMPNMATMIAVLTTDVPVSDVDLHKALKSVVGETFNKVTVDSDTSTNDTCFIFASGHAVEPAARQEAQAQFSSGTHAFQVFRQTLLHVCTVLARKMASDGEGATRLITVNVSGAASAEDADAAARTVANSPLVKTAVAGRDANWGRIAGAIGRSGAQFNQTDVDIDIMGIPVCRKGMTQPFDEEEALRRFEEPEIVFDICLGAGDKSTTVWSCDLTHDYISINADYRS